MTTARFSIPHIEDNADGWGPVNIPEKFIDIPYYAPFNKGDKLGKAADWQQQTQGKGKYQQKEAGPGVATIFDWRYQEDDASFQLVDSTKAKRFGTSRNRFQKNFQQVRQPTKQNIGQTQQKQKNQKRGQRTGYNPRNRWGENPMARKREATVSVKEDWTLIEELDFSALSKLSADEPQAEDLTTAGSIEHYNLNVERFTTKSDVSLERTERAFFNVTTSDDPIIRQLSLENAGTVFATDSILSHLMCSPKSVFPWDIVIQKVGSKLFLDKRDGSYFEYHTVNETSPDPPIDDARDPLNSNSALMREATFVNQNFSQQVLLKGKTYNFEKPNPFQSEGQDVASVGYKYRRWKLGNDLTIVSRCEVDGVTQSKGKDVFLTVKAINDDGKGEWKKTVDAQRGAVLLFEMKNNANKFAKWICQSMLAGTESIKLGYLTRTSPKDFVNHQVLAIQDYRPKELASQMNFNVKSAWGTLKRIIELCMQQPSGKYILLKEPEKASLKLYAVPEGALEQINAESKGKPVPITPTLPQVPAATLVASTNEDEEEEEEEDQ